MRGLARKAGSEAAWAAAFAVLPESEAAVLRSRGIVTYAAFGESQRQYKESRGERKVGAGAGLRQGARLQVCWTEEAGGLRWDISSDQGQRAHASPCPLPSMQLYVAPGAAAPPPPPPPALTAVGAAVSTPPRQALAVAAGAEAGPAAAEAL